MLPSKFYTQFSEKKHGRANDFVNFYAYIKKIKQNVLGYSPPELDKMAVDPTLSFLRAE